MRMGPQVPPRMPTIDTPSQPDTLSTLNPSADLIAPTGTHMEANTQLNERHLADAWEELHTHANKGNLDRKSVV